MPLLVGVSFVFFIYSNSINSVRMIDGSKSLLIDNRSRSEYKYGPQLLYIPPRCTSRSDKYALAKRPVTLIITHGMKWKAFNSASRDNWHTSGIISTTEYSE